MISYMLVLLGRDRFTAALEDNNNKTSISFSVHMGTRVWFNTALKIKNVTLSFMVLSDGFVCLKETW